MFADKNGSEAWPPQLVCFGIHHNHGTTVGDGCSGSEVLLLKGERPLRLLISSHFLCTFLTFIYG